MTRTKEQMVGDYNWEAAFEYASSPRLAGAPTDGYFFCSLLGFRLDDVTEVLASEDGENDGENWIALVKFKRTNDTFHSYGFLSAGCDYTGWDCQAGGSCYVSMRLEDIIRFGMDVHERARLDLSLSDELKEPKDG